MNNNALTRRSFVRSAGIATLGLLGAATAACGAVGEQAANPKPSTRKADLRVHLVEKYDVSEWIEKALEQDIDGFKAKNPNINVTLEKHGNWTATYFPQVIAQGASGQMGDLVWYPPRHGSHLAWGTKLKIVRELDSLVKTSKYDMSKFYKGAIEQNSWEGKMYWLSFISEPVVPIVAINKAKAQKLGLPIPKDDWTFDELVEWAKKGTTADTFGYYRGSGSGAFAGVPYLRQWGVEPTDKAGKKATYMANRDSFIRALTYRYNLMNTLKVSPNPKDGPIPKAGEDLFGVEQKILATEIWPSRVQLFERVYQGLEIDYVLTPLVKKGEKRRSMLNEHVFGVTTSTKFPEASFEFLTWMAGKEFNVQSVVQGYKGPIARNDVWGDPRITERWPAYKKMKTVMDSIEPDYLVANFEGEEFDTAFGQSYNKMERGEMPVLEAANEIQRLSQVVLDKEPS